MCADLVEKQVNLNFFAIDTYVLTLSMSPEQRACVNSSAVIACNITLNTAIGPDLSVLNYTWYHNNIDITKKSNMLEQEQGNKVMTILNISSVQLSDTGTYECSANIIGSNVTRNDSILFDVKGILNSLSHIMWFVVRNTYC